MGTFLLGDLQAVLNYVFQVLMSVMMVALALLNLTRAQATAMIGRTLPKGGAAAELAYTDAASIPNYAMYYLQTTVAQGALSGYSDGTLRPNYPITRGDVARILYAFL